MTRVLPVSVYSHLYIICKTFHWIFMPVIADVYNFLVTIQFSLMLTYLKILRFNYIPYSCQQQLLAPFELDVDGPFSNQQQIKSCAFVTQAL